MIKMVTKTTLKTAAEIATKTSLTLLMGGTMLALSPVASSSVVMAQEGDSAAFSIESKEAFEAQMRSFILENPELIIESVDTHMRAQQAEKERVSESAVRDNMDWLYDNEKHPTAGNPDGDVTIVEFFDYNCGYCKRALSDVMTIIGEDSNVRVVFIELPILGPGSTEAAKWAKASMKQGRYLEYHVAMMEHRGRLSEAQLEMIAKKVGLDVDQLKEDKESDAVMAQLQENITMARNLGITGTPAFVIGEDLARGYVGLEALKQGIAQKRLNDAAQAGDEE